MKAAWLCSILLMTCGYSYAGDTAYQALRIAGAKDQELLNHVMEVQGTGGQPQPDSWHIVVDDRTARGGVRELEVSKGRIVSEHTPVRAYVGAGGNVVMDFKHLNLDSQGAFTIANQEAAKHNIAFNSIDYTLRMDEQKAEPVWVLKLIDVKNVLVGTLTVGADNGIVIHAEGMGEIKQTASATDVYVPPPDTTGTSVPAPSPAVTYTDGEEPAPADGQQGPPYGVGHQINKGLHRLGGTLQQFFTGKRTVDKKFENEP